MLLSPRKISVDSYKICSSLWSEPIVPLEGVASIRVKVSGAAKLKAALDTEVAGAWGTGK